MWRGNRLKLTRFRGCSLEYIKSLHFVFATVSFLSYYVAVVIWIYVPPTAKVIWRSDPCLKSHPKTGEARDRTHDPWFTRQVA